MTRTSPLALNRLKVLSTLRERKQVGARFERQLASGPKLVAIASAEEVNYSVYCEVLDQMCLPVGQVVAFDFSLPPVLLKAFGDLKQMLTDIGEEFKVGFAEIVKAFKQKDVFALLKGIGFNIKTMWKALQAFTSLIPRGLFKIFESLLKTGALDKLKAGTMKLDEILHAHPLLTKLAGIAIAGLLLYIWFACSFTGNPQFDLDVSYIIAAFKGNFDLTDLFMTPEGLATIALVGLGFTGLSAGYFLGDALAGFANLILALIYTGAAKLHDSGLANKIKAHLPLKKY